MSINIQEIEETLCGNMDFVKREIIIKKRSKIKVFYMETMCDKNYISRSIMEPLAGLERAVADIEEIGRTLTASELCETTDTDDVIARILKGDALIYFEPMKYSVLANVKSIKTRAIEKSQFEPSLYGSYESFNELMFDNIGLIRKRMTAEDLVIEKHVLGSKSNTDAALLYVEGSAPQDLIDTARCKLKTLSEDTDFVLNIENVAEQLNRRRTLFDIFYYTEKPDTIAAALFEGRVVVLVNGDPHALVAPSFFFEIIHSPDDYAANSYYVSFLRFLRFFALLLALLLPGFYVALTTHHYALIPTAFVFKLAVSRSGVPFPTVIEVLILHFFFEMAREAGRRLPHQIGQALSIVGALILGDAAVGAGLASQATVVIIGTYAIASLINTRATPWMTLWSVILIIISAAFGLHGFYLGVFLFVANLASLRSCHYPYLFPFGTERSFKGIGRDIFMRKALNKISKPFIYGGKKDGKDL